MTDAMTSYSNAAVAFDESFTTNPRRAMYDRLGWDAIGGLDIPQDAKILDAGCGTGRWCRRFLDLGHDVIGIENAPGMVDHIRDANLGPRFTLIEADMSDVALDPPPDADLVIAIGSIQYCADQDQMIANLFRWTAPGGQIAVMVDSLVALVSELLQDGRPDEALRVLRTRQGSFTDHGATTRLHLYDHRSLRAAFARAGFVDLACRGLVAQGASLGRAGLADAMQADADGFASSDAAIADHDVMADSGLHLLLTGRRPIVAS